MDALDRNTHYSYLSDSNKNVSFSIQPHLKELLTKKLKSFLLKA